VQGDNELQVWCTKDSSSDIWSVQKINILIQTRYPTLNIKGIKTEPQIISPGEDSKLLFTMENLADSAMKDINVKLDLSSVNFAPIGEMAEKKLRVLESGGIADLIFSIKALPDTKGGVYKIPFTLTYSDNIGTNYSQEGLIAVEVGSKPEMIYSIDSATISKSSKMGEISIKIINTGLSNLKLLSSEILPSEKFKLLSSSVIYIGDIDSDDFGTATYKLTVKTSKDFDIPLKISFRDTSNTKYTNYVNVTFKMLSASEMGQKSIFGTLITILIIIAIALILIIRRLREKVKGLIVALVSRFKK
jgi:hypothetical protein